MDRWAHSIYPTLCRLWSMEYKLLTVTIPFFFLPMRRYSFRSLEPFIKCLAKRTLFITRIPISFCVTAMGDKTNLSGRYVLAHSRSSSDIFLEWLENKFRNSSFHSSRTSSRRFFFLFSLNLLFCFRQINTFFGYGMHPMFFCQFAGENCGIISNFAWVTSRNARGMNTSRENYVCSTT